MKPPREGTLPWLIVVFIFRRRSASTTEIVQHLDGKYSRERVMSELVTLTHGFKIDRHGEIYTLIPQLRSELVIALRPKLEPLPPVPPREPRPFRPLSSKHIASASARRNDADPMQGRAFMVSGTAPKSFIRGLR